MKFQMKCTCGDVMTVDAENKDEAVKQMKELMNKEALKAHFEEKHKGEMVPPVALAHMLIAQNVKAVE